MNLRTALDTAATAVVGAANRIDELATDLELSRGRVTVVGRALKLGATLTAATAIPVVILDFVTGGPAARRRHHQQVVEKVLAQPAR